MPRMYSAPTPLPRPPMEITNLTAMPVDVECKANASPSGTAPTGNSASPAGGIAPSPPRSLTQPAPAPPLPTAGPEPASAITTTSGSATVPLHAHHMASSSMTSICSSSSGANTAVPHFVTSDSSSVSASTASSVPASNSSSISTTSSSTPQTPISFPTAFPSPGSGKQDPCQVSASPAARQNSIKHKTAGSPGAVLQAASALKVNLHISPNPQAKLGQSAQSGSVCSFLSICPISMAACVLRRHGCAGGGTGVNISLSASSCSLWYKSNRPRILASIHRPPKLAVARFALLRLCMLLIHALCHRSLLQAQSFQPL